MIVPRKGVIELARILAAEGGDIRLSLGENYVRVEAPDFLYLSKLIEGAYPDYERVIPRDLPRYLVVEREPFRQALSRAAILTNEKFKGIRLNIERDRLRILANNPEQEEAEEELSVEYSAEGALEIGFNVTYLLDVLGVIEGSRVRMEFRDAGQSVLLVDPEQAEAMRHVVMPMRL
ncbi:MAG: hypothetical protein KatS3mg124_1876 [Porticoccaceae bacterium]|nr:MAG: hypothetical protein KatS3mg124_1876 [Porticoccaceae bacterium]